MQCTVFLRCNDGDPPALHRVEFERLHRDVADPKLGDVGPPLAEGTRLLQIVQQEFAMAQTQQLRAASDVPICGASRRRHCGYGALVQIV